jgi:hypothetical protein
MTTREARLEAKPPGLYSSHSFSWGGADSAMRDGRSVVWATAAFALLSFAWAASLTLYVAFHDDVIGAILERQVAMKAAYEDRLAEARARLDEAASQQLIERNSFKSKINEVMFRQARLEQRGAMVAALANTEARDLSPRSQGAASVNPPDAVSAIRSLGFPVAGAPVDDAARA